MTKKAKNPLYVVTDKGNVVQEAANRFDAMIKKFNLTPVIEVINMLIEWLLEQVRDYPTFMAIKKFIDSLVGRVELFVKFSLV